MIIVQPGGNVLIDGAVVLEPKEPEVLIHALVAEQERVLPGQTHYGPMTIEEFKAFVKQIQALKNHP